MRASINMGLGLTRDIELTEGADIPLILMIEGVQYERVGIADGVAYYREVKK